MDRPRVVGPLSSVRRVVWIATALAAIGAFVAADRLWLRTDGAVDLADFATAGVQRGTLAIEVQGAGALEPVSERWITAEVQGTVQDVLVLPGGKVAAGDMIVRLANPQVRRRVAQARLSLAESEADRRSHRASATERRLAAEARVLDAQADHDEQDLRLEAQTELRKRNAVSEVDFRSQGIRTERANARLDFERRRYDELKASLEAESDARDARVAARRAALSEAEAEMASLSVAANAAGTLRELLVEPGAHVPAGARVARVVDTSSLMAVVRVPESYASRLVAGQRALATVLGLGVPGVVVRVDPAVTDGAVAVDIELEDRPPVGARPDLSVRATITVAQLDDVLFVRRPAQVRDHATVDVFVLADDGRVARRTVVGFGAGTPTHVEVVHGLLEDQTVLLGDVSRLIDRDVVPVR